METPHMGRRALPKIDPALDLSVALCPAESLPRPWSASQFFGREAPLEVEVGSGKGLFLAAAARSRPKHDFLGIELATKFARLSAARLAKAAAPNACVVHGDAVRVFREVLPDCAAVAVHVYFPDPWWKARHKKRRVMRESLVRDIERVLVPGGSLHFWTDVEEYFRTTLDLIAATTALHGPFDVPEVDPQHDLDYRTHFERRTRLSGKPVFRAEFRRADGPTSAGAPMTHGPQ